ncbi:MAG TPA: NAD-dependent deacylase [Verrucomicrobiales bacterium]|nr:NAD-dependent deacylase [Verrucomicrobiales bacterium]
MRRTDAMLRPAPQTIIPPALVEQLREARSVAVLTGAGISAESGVPTFRDALTGLWEQFRPQELATPEAFLQNPKLVWEWYAWRRKLINTVSPNPGHEAIAKMAKRFQEFTLITQNVDGLHQRAGNVDVLELHGNLHRVRCLDHHHIAAAIPDPDVIAPRCAECGSLLRPDIVWFGEALPAGTYRRAEEAASACDVFLSLGTSGIVYPAAGLPQLAASRGICLVEINTTETELSRLMTYCLRGPTGRILPQLLEQLDQRAGGEPRV